MEPNALPGTLCTQTTSHIKDESVKTTLSTQHTTALM